MSEKLAGKVAVVTGAASGIGLATSRLFLQHGASVHMVDFNELNLKAEAEKLAEFEGRLFMHVVDCREAVALEQLAESVYAEHENVHVVFNNAGIGQLKPAVETTVEDWNAVLSINLHGVVNGISAFLPRLRNQADPAHIFNTASILGLLPLTRMAPYCASKFAVVGLSESLDMELRRVGIRVSAVCPGAVRTNIARSMKYEIPGVDTKKAIETFESQGMEPEKVAKLILNATLSRRGGLLIIAGPLRVLYWARSISTRLYRWLMEWLDHWTQRKLRAN